MTELTPEQKLIVYAIDKNMKDALEFAGITEHPLFPRDAWVAAVIAGTTDAAYGQWVVNNAKVYDEIETQQSQRAQPKKVAAPASVMAQARAAIARPQEVSMSTDQLRKLVEEWNLKGDEA